MNNTAPLLNTDTTYHAGEWCDAHCHNCNCEDDYEWYTKNTHAFASDNEGHTVADIYRVDDSKYHWTAFWTDTIITVERRERHNYDEPEIAAVTVQLKYKNGRTALRGTNGTLQDITIIDKGYATTPEGAAQAAMDAYGKERMDRYEPPEPF